MPVESESIHRAQRTIDLARTVLSQKGGDRKGKTAFIDKDGDRIFRVDGVLSNAEVSQFHERIEEPEIHAVSRELVTKHDIEVAVEDVLGEPLSVNGLPNCPSTLRIQKPHNGTIDLWEGLTEGARNLPRHLRRKLSALLAAGPRALLVSNHFLDIEMGEEEQRDERGNVETVEVELSRAYRSGFRIQAQAAINERDYSLDFASDTPWVKGDFDKKYERYLKRVRILGDFARSAKQGGLIGMPVPPPEAAYNACHLEIAIIVLNTIEKMLKNDL